MWVLVICSFMGGNMYECDEGMTFETVDACEEVARDVDEAKGLTSYCIESDFSTGL